MTCKDCFKADVCQNQFFCMENSRNTYSVDDVEKRCKHFADKSKIIELPCKVGDTVYYIGGIHNTLVKSAKVEEIYYNGDDFALRLYGTGVYFTLQLSEVFLTPEEADKALKERENK